MTNLLSGFPTAEPSYSGTIPGYQSNGSVQGAPANPGPIAAVNVGENLSGAPASDTVQIQSRSEGKKGPVKKLKGFIAGIKKSFATAGTYAAGTVKGLGRAAVGASVVYTGGQVVNTIRAGKAAKVATQAMKNTATKEEIKKAGAAAAAAVKKVPNKALAIATGILALGATLWTASLDATEKRSEIEHRWTGHQ